MAISDHINFTGVNPLFGAGPGDSRFVDMVDAYDPMLRRKLLDAAKAANVVCHEGVYIFFSGPSFERILPQPMPVSVAVAALGAGGLGTSGEIVVIRRSPRRRPWRRRRRSLPA